MNGRAKARVATARVARGLGGQLPGGQKRVARAWWPEAPPGGKRATSQEKSVSPLF